MLRINNQNELVEGKFVGKNIDKIIIGPDIKYIPENCFNDCRNLNEITFEGNINNIEAAAFMGCKNLKTINANNINVIKDFAFYDCDNIINFNINENVANNIKFGFYNNSLSKYFKLPEIGMPFNDIPWRKINLISKKGKAKDYFTVGDEKELQIGSETYHIQIIGFNHDDKSDGIGKAGITVGLKEIMTTTAKMNDTDTNVGGWKDSKMRTYLNETVHNSLPSDLQTVIKTVNKKSDNGNMDKTALNTTQDKLFLFSTAEVGLDVDGQGTKYEYFSDNNSREKKYLSGESSDYWLRSAYSYDTSDFYEVNSDGSNGDSYASNSYGVAPAFCI